MFFSCFFFPVAQLQWVRWGSLLATWLLFCVAGDSVVILAPFLGRSCQLEPLLMSFLLSVRHLIGSGSVQLTIKARVWCLSVPQVWVILFTVKNPPANVCRCGVADRTLVKQRNKNRQTDFQDVQITQFRNLQDHLAS